MNPSNPTPAIRSSSRGSATPATTGGVADLFLDRSGAPLPTLGEVDPDFVRHGLRRPALVLRGMSRVPDPRAGANIRFALRALVGVGVRYVDWARIFAALAHMWRVLLLRRSESDEYGRSVRTREALTVLRDALPIEGIDVPMPEPKRFPGAEVEAHAECVFGQIAAALDALTVRTSARPPRGSAA